MPCTKIMSYCCCCCLQALECLPSISVRLCTLNVFSGVPISVCMNSAICRAEGSLWLRPVQLAEDQEVGDQLLPVGGAYALWVELHPVQGPVAVSNGHEDVLHSPSTVKTGNLLTWQVRGPLGAPAVGSRGLPKQFGASLMAGSQIAPSESGT